MFEQLEDRSMLSGVVEVVVTGANLTLTGDGSNNQVEIRQIAPHNYRLTSPDDTQFLVGGFLMQEVPVSGISGNISVDLGDGNDLFRFLGVSPGVQSSVGGDLDIFNSDGSNVNEVIDTLINGDLNVDKVANTSGYSELTIRDSHVIGDVNVDNVSSGNEEGDTKTVIDDSHLDQYLRIFNPYGTDIVDILANTQIGRGNFQSATPNVNIIDEYGGPSRITFSGSNQVAGLGTTTVYGDIEIINAENNIDTLNILTFNSVNVLGFVDVINGHGDTETMVINSTLGSSQDAAPGGPLTINNMAGYDTLFIKDSRLPWGLEVDNDVSAPEAFLQIPQPLAIPVPPDDNSNWGSSSSIADSEIGEYVDPTDDNAVWISGDNGADSLSVTNSTIAGVLRLYFYDGQNSVSLLNNPSTVNSIYYTGGVGHDDWVIQNTAILYDIYIDLYDGDDTLEIRNMNFATQWPSPLFHYIDIDAGSGTDTFIGDIPPTDFFDDFQFFEA